ncbi:MAG: hypothetical protein PHF00_08870 [Elusimicrobia bacterium]|nr:hypothetical protein [Elusimicrobiota bacterium]
MASKKLPATRSDVATATRGLRAEISKTARDLRTEIGNTKQELRAEISKTTQELKAEIGKTTRELSAVDKKLAVAVANLEARMTEQKTEIIDTIRGDIHEMRNAVLEFLNRTENDHRAMIVHGQALSDAQVQLKDHEGRISRLETRPSA